MKNFAAAWLAVVLSACVLPSLAQESATSTRTETETASLTSTSSVASGTDEPTTEQSAACFQQCYKEHGDLATCPYGPDALVQCWCTASEDWADGEEDCVWLNCGAYAYNGYGNILKQVCGTATLRPGVTPSSTTSKSSFTTPTTTFHSTCTHSDDPLTGTTTSGEAQPTTSENPNVGAFSRDSGAAAGLLVGVAYLFQGVL